MCLRSVELVAAGVVYDDDTEGEGGTAGEGDTEDANDIAGEGAPVKCLRPDSEHEGDTEDS